MARNQKDFTFDYEHRLKDAGAIAASAAAQVGGADKIVDLGAGRVDARVIVDITAVEVDTGNEKYQLMVQFSTSPTFASGVWNGTALILGDSTQSLESADTVVGRRELPFTNEINGTVYRYMRMYTFVAGTIATGINYVANIARQA
jgi:hypothetical protein